MGLEKREGGPRTAELEFQVVGDDCFVVAASEREGCRVTLLALQPRSDGCPLAVVSVDGADPERVREVCEHAAGVSECRLLERREDGGFLQFVAEDRGVATTLADAGAVAHDVRAADGDGRVLAAVPPAIPVREVVDAVEAAHGNVRLVACRRRNGVSFEGSETGRESLLAELTERQREAARTAHSRGYFAWPREETAEGCAAVLGVTQPTFSQHLRTGQQKLFDRLFPEAGPTDTQYS